MMINRLITTLLLMWLGFTLQLPGQQVHPERIAFEQIKASAEKGNAEAQLELGALYASGTGVTRDLGKAAKWHRKAAEQGLAPAQYQIGCDYANGEGVKINPAEAARWFRLAADQGIVEAQFEFGLRCMSGQGVRENGGEAVDWFRKAAAQGFTPAEYRIGICYFEGIGVPKSIEEGIKWIRSAAERGDPIAQNKFGACYEKGDGVPKDYVQAYKWYALSAAQDDQHALDIKVSLARLEGLLTRDQLAEAQRLAHDSKPIEKSDLPGSTPPAVSAPAVLGSAKMGGVTVKADDDHCDVFVDGAFVGNPPAKLRLAEGSHVVEVKKSGFKDYHREMKVIAGSDLTLTVGLERLNSKD